MSDRITISEKGVVVTPDTPTIPCMPGDGIGVDIWKAAVTVFDAAVERAYQGKRRVNWLEIPVGEVAFAKTGQHLPEESLETIRTYRVAIKGPLTTPVGHGFRSVNVALRQLLDLYACVRPISYIPRVPSPVKRPSAVDMVIFRENTEDVYMGIEWEAGSAEALQVIQMVEKLTGRVIRSDSGIGLKPISKFGTRRIVRQAMNYAIANKSPNVTLVHKGNIMKFTEGAFRQWGYELIAEEFADVTITEEELWEKYEGVAPAGKIVVKDRIADAMFQQILLRPDEYSVLVMPNLNGDYLSDSLAACVGGLGLAPGANIGDGYAIFEATHGSAPKYAMQDKVNPSSVILSGAMMFDFLGWAEVATYIRNGVAGAIGAGTVTYDLARQMEGATEISCSAFGNAICQHM